MAGKLLMIKFVKMKKKIVFAVATGFFAVATVFNMNMIQNNSFEDISLDAIAVMAQAQTESGMPDDCEAVWENVSCKSSDGKTYSYSEPKKK